MPRRLDAATRDRIQTVWNELADFSLADQDAALVHALRAFGALVRAREGTWCGAVRLARAPRDPLQGWRPRARLTIALPAPERRSRPSAADGDTRWLGRCLRQRSGAAHAGYSTSMDGHTIGVACHVTTDVASSFLWSAPRAPFTLTERAVLLYAMRGLKWFHRQMLVSHGLAAARTPFTPAEQAVLPLVVLDHLPDAVIAARLAVPPRVVRAHVHTIAAKVGVAGRVDLVALWDSVDRIPAN